MAEKTEKPTSKKYKDSAKKGQSFKSKDLITTAVILAGVHYLAYGMSFRDFINFYSMALMLNTELGINDFLIGLLRVFMLLILPFIAMCAVVGIIAALFQTKFSIATEAIKLNFKALNPVSGFKKIFSARTVKELVKSVCYLFVFACTAYSLIHNDLRQTLTLYRGDLDVLVTRWISLTLKAVLVFMSWSLFVLIADLIVEYFLHFKDLKMDKHEVKQERKESDGNPQIKSARRKAHQAILTGEEMAAVRNSEVVMANPTHIAIAIYFNPEKASLPFIALRCTNMKAKAAISYAEEIGVPVIRNISLTRRLYHSYSQYNFISLNDDVLIDIMDILIWLRQVETVGMEHFTEATDNTEELAADYQKTPTDHS